MSFRNLSSQLNDLILSKQTALIYSEFKVLQAMRSRMQHDDEDEDDDDR